MFTMQSLVVLGYNCIPLPGGTGIYEFLYMKIYNAFIPSSFIVISMMCTRLISYYLSLVISGIYTIIYHIKQLKRKKEKITKDEMVTANI